MLGGRVAVGAIAATCALFIGGCGPTQEESRARLASDALLPNCATGPIGFQILESGGLVGQDYLDELTTIVSRKCRSDWLAKLNGNSAFKCMKDRCETERDSVGKQISVDLSVPTVTVRIDKT